MSQHDMTIANGDGATVRVDAQDALQALASMSKGSTAPATKYAGQLWLDDAATPWVVKQWDGTDWITWGTVNATTNLFTVITPPSPPQGRLTLATGEPVMSSSQAGKTLILYTPYVGNRIPIYDGSAFTMEAFTELSNDTTASSTGKAGPAAVTTDSNYDLFVWSDSGTLRLTRGPLWTSGTARGTGSGTSELQRIAGIWTNKVAISNGPGANLGTYVGTVRSNGSSQIDFIPGGSAAGGTAAVLGVWNAWNRVSYGGLIGDTTNSWTYSTATWRAADNSNGMRVSLVAGLQEDFATTRAYSQVGTAVAGSVAVGIGYDSTTAPSGPASYWLMAGTNLASPVAEFTAQPLGFHYFQQLEKGTAAGTTTWYGDNGTSEMFTALTYGWRC